MHRHALAMLLFVSSVCHARQDALAQCLDRLADDAQFAPIAGKLALGSAASTSPSMHADTALPHERELKVIADWAAARGECIKAANRSGNAMYRPPVLAIGRASPSVRGMLSVRRPGRLHHPVTRLRFILAP